MSTYVQKQLMLNKEVAEEGELYIGYDSIVLFTISVMATFVMAQYFQTPDLPMDLFFIAIIQTLMGLVGFMLGYMISKDKINLTYPTKFRRNETYFTGSVYASIVMLLDSFINRSQTGMWGFNVELFAGEWNIPLTAAVVEDAFFSLFIAILFYKIFARMFRSKGSFDNVLAIIFASIFTGFFFMLIHMNVYGREGLVLFLMMFNRIIYTLVFLKHRNFSMMVWMHIFHNILAITVG